MSVTALQERAAHIVAELAERLADPDGVAARATAEGNVDHLPGRAEQTPPWAPLGLAEGHPGVALLFAELADSIGGLRAAGHAHLRAAAAGLAGPQPTGLFAGPASLAHAARLARHRPGDYASLLDSLDAWIADRLRSLLTVERQRLDAGRAGVRLSAFDVISGTAGLGRYLLLTPDRHRPLLEDTLTHLVRLTRPVDVNGIALPGWWAPTIPGAGPQDSVGHANLGLAHGISGPLALLALAWRSGVRVAGHPQAVHTIVDHLLEWQHADGSWPQVVGHDALLAGPGGGGSSEGASGAAGSTGDGAGEGGPSGGGAGGNGRRMIAWCYGTPGVARALQLAGLALDRADWRRRAEDALSSVLGDPADALPDTSLCHGRAGVLHIATLMARDSGDPRLTARLPALLSRVLDAYDPAQPFGFRYDRPSLPGSVSPAPHRAGFLDGAAGIALALTAHRAGPASSGAATAWDTTLLLN
ncbi:lanthionine synthetase C family protein [Kitasatospora sp. NPDC092039]|uniref:lanthionine synthetase C family protein n=1 Tax=Kitasatospora sp. NPDC092039 TaxID=3364086 RepID=UPI0037FFD0DE